MHQHCLYTGRETSGIRLAFGANHLICQSKARQAKTERSDIHITNLLYLHGLHLQKF